MPYVLTLGEKVLKHIKPLMALARATNVRTYTIDALRLYEWYLRNKDRGYKVYLRHPEDDVAHAIEFDF